MEQHGKEIGAEPPVRSFDPRSIIPDRLLLAAEVLASE
jgi:hypothetical protein